MFNALHKIIKVFKANFFQKHFFFVVLISLEIIIFSLVINIILIEKYIFYNLSLFAFFGFVYCVFK